MGGGATAIFLPSSRCAPAPLPGALRRGARFIEVSSPLLECFHSWPREGGWAWRTAIIGIGIDCNRDLVAVDVQPGNPNPGLVVFELAPDSAPSVLYIGDLVNPQGGEAGSIGMERSEMVSVLVGQRARDLEQHDRMVGLVERMLELHERLAEARI